MKMSILEKGIWSELFELIGTWFLPRGEQIVPEAKKEIKKCIERLIIFKQREKEKEIVKILETNLDRLNPKIVMKIAKQLLNKKKRRGFGGERG